MKTKKVPHRCGTFLFDEHKPKDMRGPACPSVFDIHNTAA
jgi:hypothetical protein